MTQHRKNNSKSTTEQTKPKTKKLSPKAKKRIAIGAVCSVIALGSLSYSRYQDIQDSLGHRTDCPSFEFRKYLIYLQTLLENKESELDDKHFLQPLLQGADHLLESITSILKEQDDHYGDTILDFATEELEEWHYESTNGDTVFHSEVIDGEDAAISHWSSYVASLHGLNGWDFSIHVIHVTDKTVEDVNRLILETLPNEGQILIDAISTPGFEFESFYLEGRRVDLGVYDWGIEFLFYLPTDENPLEKE